MTEGQGTILVVDDDPSAAGLEAARLAQAGYRTVVVVTAAEALLRARAGDIDLAIVDLRLDDSHCGLDLVADFRKAGLSIPVIIVTAFSEEAVVIRALRSGVADFIPKSNAYLDYLPEAVARVLSRVRTELRLAESESRFVSFMDNGPAFCFIKDHEGRFLFVNKQLRQLVDIGDWIGKTIFDALPFDLAQQIHDDDQEVIRSGEPSKKHYRGVGLDGAFQQWVTYRFPMRDIHGERLMGGVCVDVSEATRAQEALRTSEAKFRSVSESATDAIVAMDQFGNIVSWNTGAARMFGYAAEEMLGQSIEQIVPPRYREAQRAAFARIAAQGFAALRGHPMEMHALRRDGSEFPIELSVGHWQDGGELYFSGIVRDVTDRKRADEELRKRDEQLRHSQRLEALGTLAGGVAHEFNNLLQSIQGYTRYAIEGLEPGDRRRLDLELVLTAADRAAALTRQLLGFSRRQVLENMDLEPNRIVEEAAHMLRPLIGRHIQLELSLADNLERIHADPTQLHQLLMNLAVNARDAMPGGGRLLITTAGMHLDAEQVRALPHLEPGEYLELTVSDTGCGMSDDVLEHAFEPFFTTKEVGCGTGLGLASVYGVVTQQRGAIRVESEPGVGTSFRILLPLVKGAEHAPPVASDSPRARNQETILVAEDEPLVRDLVIRKLESAGYRTIAVQDGQQALDVFRDRRHEISVVMLDVVMPRLSGPDAYRQMREIDPSRKAIFTSAYDPETAQLPFLGDRQVRFVQKPYDGPSLTQAIRDVLDASPTIRGAPLPAADSIPDPGAAQTT